MRDYSPLVRFSNDGTEFHVLWAVRCAMRMLSPGSELRGIAIEGEGPGPKKGDPLGLLAIDLAEYYGGERLADADRVVLRQMKYSTTSGETPWAAGDLADTIGSFAQRYLDAVAEHGQAHTTKVLRFAFVTNRPISKNLLLAVEAARQGDIPTKPAAVAKAYTSAFRDSGLNRMQLKRFARLLELEGNEGKLPVQAAEATTAIHSYLPVHDNDVIVRMKELVRTKMLSASEGNNLIDAQSLLVCFRVSGLEELLPAVAKFEPAHQFIEREQYASLAASIVAERRHAVVEAEGGVGKSVLAQRLPYHMPPGSVSVVFDGFAGGDYRNPRLSRHRHAVGIVQLANQLAMHGLCDPLVPSSGATPQDYLRSWRARIEQAVAALRSRDPGALLLVVIDAGDSLGIAAQERVEPSFVPDLLQDTAVEGYRLVVTARPERVTKYLKPTAKVGRHVLSSFTLAESGRHLRSAFPGATEAQAVAFHALTSQNPRVQANALQPTSTLDAVLRRLLGVPTDVDRLIARQMEVAFSEVVEHSGDSGAPDRLRAVLGVLSPPIPLRAIAATAQVSEAAVSSFVTDLASGRALLVRDGSVQFRDEPTETWFRDRAGLPAVDFATLAEALADLAVDDFYAASELPRLLYLAERYDALTSLALASDVDEYGDPLKNRAILHQRVKFALKGALIEGKTGDAIRLLLRTGEESAGSDRRDDFLLDQPFLATVFTAREHIHDFIFGKKPWHRGRRAYVACAALLVGAESTDPECRRFLQLAGEWLEGALQVKKRGGSSGEEDDNLELSDIALLAESWLLLDGPQSCLAFMDRWYEWVQFLVMKTVVASLMSRGELSRCHGIWAASGTRRAIRMAVASELACACVVPKHGMASLIDSLNAEPIDLDSFDDHQRDEVLLSCVAICEAAARARVAPGRIRALLEKLPRQVTRSSWLHNRKQRVTVLRAATLWAALGRTSVVLGDMWNGGEVKEHGKPSQGPSDEFTRLFGGALPWFQLRADVICQNDTPLEESIEDAKKNVVARSQGYGADGWADNAGEDVAWAGVEAFCWSSACDPTAAAELCTWLESRGLVATSHTWAALARMLAHRPEEWHGTMLCCAARGAALIELQRSTAEESAEGFRDLAAAVCPRNRAEARAYFESALSRLGDIGDAELHDRLKALLALADGAAGGDADAHLAYRLSRAAEVLYAHNSHKFPWGDVAGAIAEISPAMAVAGTSRWQDSGVASQASVLFQLLPRLVEKGWLSPAASIALRPLSSSWIREDVLELHNAAPGERQRLWDVLLGDLCLSSGERLRQAHHLAALARRYGLSLGELPALTRSWKCSMPTKARRERTWRSPRKRSPRSWGRIVGSAPLSTPRGVTEVIARYDQAGPRGDAEALFSAMRGAVPVGEWVAHLNALASCEGLDARDIADALEAAFANWGTSASVLAARHKVVERFLASRMTEIATTAVWQLVRIINWCERIAGWDRPTAIRLITRGLADAIDQMSAGSLFYCAGLLGRESQSSSDARLGLTYGLDRLERSMRPDDGDGEWRSELEIPNEAAPTVARLLYATLGSHEAETRWRAAHAVRRLCAAGEAEIVGALGACLGVTRVPAFSDSRFVFYFLNAELYTVIALARAAMEWPHVVAACRAPLIEAISDDHVLKRQFAAVALLALEEAKGTGCDPALVADLVAVSRPAHTPIKAKWRATEARSKRERKRAGGFDLDYQVVEYWCPALARAFDVESAEIQRRAERIAEKRWAATGLGEWTADMRRQAGVYHGETYAGHGTPPANESLAFYLSMHAVHCVAGQLLKEKPPVVLYDEQEGDEWQSWLEDHSLTRPDGQWLSDCRERAPIEMPAWVREPVEWDRREVWASSVGAGDLDEALGVGGGLEEGHLVIAGSWRQKSGGRQQSVQVNSALVSRADSMALMRALQTASFPYSFFLPSEAERNIRIGGLRLRGWVSVRERHSGLDGRDPYAKNVEWPAPALSAAVKRRLAITPVEPERLWTCEAGAIRLRVWGDDPDRGSEELTTSGQRLSADVRFFRHALAELHHDIIFQVRIRRTHAHVEKAEGLLGPYDDYTRIYLLRSGLELHTLHECHRLGPKARRRSR